MKNLIHFMNQISIPISEKKRKKVYKNNAPIRNFLILFQIRISDISLKIILINKFIIMIFYNYDIKYLLYICIYHFHVEYSIHIFF